MQGIKFGQFVNHEMGMILQAVIGPETMTHGSEEPAIHKAETYPMAVHERRILDSKVAGHHSNDGNQLQGGDGFEV